MNRKENNRKLKFKNFVLTNLFMVIDLKLFSLNYPINCFNYINSI
jgi:hypothetical protein